MSVDYFSSVGMRCIEDRDITEDIYGFIYITVNTVDGMRYIGKKCTSCKNWKHYLGSGIRLKRAISKYGRDKFCRYIVDTASSIDELNQKEMQWIEMFNATKNERFYNIASGGDGGNVRSGYTEDEYIKSETYRRSIVSASARKRCGSLSSKSKLVECQVLEIIDRLLDNDERIADIASDYNVSYGTIMDIRNHKTWKHLTDGIEFFDISHRGTKTEYVWNTRKVNVYTKDMEYVGTFKSAREAERATGVGFRLISQVCNGEKKTSHGLIFRFEDDTFNPYDKFRAGGANK